MTRQARLLTVAVPALWLAALARIVRMGGEWEPGRLPVGWDLASFRVAARLLVTGRGDELYEFAEQARVHAQLYGEGRDFYPFAYPPGLAALFVPLDPLPQLAAWAVMTVVGVALLLLSAELLGVRKLAMLWTVASFPGFAAILGGQLSLIVLFVFAQVYALSQAGRPFAAGLVASALVLKPQMLIMLPLALALSPRPARAIAGLAAGVSVAVAASVALAPTAALAYPRAVASFATHVSEHFRPALVFTWGTFGNMLAPSNDVIRIGVILVGIGASAVAAVVAMVRHRANPPVLYSIATIATLACSPHCSHYDWTLLAMPAALLLPKVTLSTRAAWVLVSTFAAGWLIVPLAEAQQRLLPFAVHPGMPVLVGLYLWMLRPLQTRRRHLPE